MTDWATVTISGLQNFWEGFINFIPLLTTEILKRIKLDKIFEAKGWQDSLEKAEIHEKPSGFIGAIIKWILIIVFLAIAVEILGLPQFSAFLQKILAWIPNLLVAILIFVATVIIANFAEKLVKASVSKSGLGYTGLAGAIVRWAVWIFGIFAILIQLGIAKNLILALFYGIVGFVVIAGGLAFGLGGKEVAEEVLKNFTEKIKK